MIKIRKGEMGYMNKIYLVNHCFDVDGGFGDAIPQEEVICGFDNREDMWWFD